MRRQRGFTLVELIVVMAISGLLIPVITSAIYQIVKGTAYNSNKVVAMEDIEGVANWVSRDVAQAQSTNLANDALVDLSVPGNSFRVDWLDLANWDGQVGWVPEQHFAEYTLSGTLLQRNYDGATNIVARYVSNVGFSRSGSLITMSITSDVPGGSPRTENLSYNFIPRVSGGLQ